MHALTRMHCTRAGTGIPLRIYMYISRLTTLYFQDVHAHARTNSHPRREFQAAVGTAWAGKSILTPGTKLLPVLLRC